MLKHLTNSVKYRVIATRMTIHVTLTKKTKKLIFFKNKKGKGWPASHSRHLQSGGCTTNSLSFYFLYIYTFIFFY
jgi:hypothetical protein